MRFFNGHETLEPQVSSIHKASVPPFVGLTMGLLRFMRVLDEEYMAYSPATFRNFGGLKKRFLPCRLIVHSRATGLMLANPCIFGNMQM
jgi:hypothetical protein